MNAVTHIESWPYADLLPRETGCVVPLTAAQRLGWSYLASHGQPSERMCAAALEIEGPLDTGLLERCFELAIQRHESLRTRIVVAGGVPQQKIDLASGYEMDKIDLSMVALT